MSRNLGDPWDEIERLTARIRALEKATMLANASVGGGRLRFYDGGELLIEGGNLRVTGTGSVSGTFNVSGTLNVTGTTNLDGPVIIDGNTTVNGSLGITGPTTITGNTAISGTLAVNGATTLNNDLTLGSGRIVAGPLRIDKLGAAGGRVASTGQLILTGSSVFLGASTTIDGPLGVNGMTNLNGLDVSGAKSFIMAHPTREGWVLRHGATESPVSGVEYWGEATLDADGSAEVVLPDYFEALVKPDSAVAFVTGRGFAPSWSDVTDGKFAISGANGGRVSWLVKAERIGGDFNTESPKDEPPADPMATAVAG